MKPCRKCGGTDRNKFGQCLACKKRCRDNYNARHPGRARELHAKWIAANREKARAMQAKWAAANPEYVRANSLRWNKENLQHCRDSEKKRREEHPEMHKAIVHKRRALKKKSGGSFTAEEVRSMLKRQRGKCLVCKVDISKAYHIDHVMPLVLGGSNGISNIQLLCPHCNLSKQSKHPITFMQSRGFLL